MGFLAFCDYLTINKGNIDEINGNIDKFNDKNCGISNTFLIQFIE